MNKNDKEAIASMMKHTRRYGEIQVPKWNWHIAELIVSAYPKEFGIDNKIGFGSLKFKEAMKRLYLVSRETKPDDAS